MISPLSMSFYLISVASIKWEFVHYFHYAWPSRVIGFTFYLQHKSFFKEIKLGLGDFKRTKLVSFVDTE